MVEEERLEQSRPLARSGVRIEKGSNTLPFFILYLVFRSICTIFAPKYKQVHTDMIQSMTGYGNAVVTYKDKKIHVEIKSLNSKQLDLQARVAPLYRE